VRLGISSTGAVLQKRSLASGTPILDASAEGAWVKIIEGVAGSHACFRPLTVAGNRPALRARETYSTPMRWETWK
jgi:hypothetical protein